MSAELRYTVLEGDCLWTIARRHGLTLRALLQANRHLSDPDRLSPGTEVLIPGPDGPGAMKGFFNRARESLVGTVRRFGAGDCMPELVEVAQEQVGVGEMGVNSGGIVRYTGGKVGWPWAARMVSWCYRQAGIAMPGGDLWSIAQLKSTVRRTGQWREADALQPGMICTFRAWSHVEIVVAPVQRGGRLVGYNTVGPAPTKARDGRFAVAQTFRPLGEIEGGGYPVRV